MKPTTKTIITRVLSVIIDVILAFAGSAAMIFGTILLYPYPLITYGNYVEPRIYIPDFITGIIIILLTLTVPVVLNLLLYHFWYRKCGLSKKWIIIPIIIIAAILLLTFIIIAKDFMADWFIAEWER